MPIIRSWALTRGFSLHPGTRNRYEIRYTRTQHRPASRQVNDHGRVSGTHRQRCAAPCVVFVAVVGGLERREVSDVSLHEKFLWSRGVCPGTFPAMRIGA